MIICLKNIPAVWLGGAVVEHFNLDNLTSEIVNFNWIIKNMRFSISTRAVQKSICSSAISVRVVLKMNLLRIRCLSK